MSYCVRYFADRVVTLKGIGAGLATFDPGFKIDGGEVLRGGELLGEVEISATGSDLFAEDLAANIAECERVASHAAAQVVARLRTAQSIVTLRVLDGERDPAVTWDLLTPIWTVLPSLSTGLTQMDGQGFYDGSQLIVAIS
ncbi:MAG: hypothetical protein NT062_22945 [Proteobacteria bacterium]|nr:hypothetical protein [Pseudomonadota bacterium]